MIIIIKCVYNGLKVGPNLIKKEMKKTQIKFSYWSNRRGYHTQRQDKNVRPPCSKKNWGNK